MVALGWYLLALHGGLLLVAAVLMGGSLAGFTGGVPMILTTVVVLVGWAALAVLLVVELTFVVPLLRGRGDPDRALRWSRRVLTYLSVLAPLTGLGLAFLSFIGCGPLWLPPFLHWLGLVTSVIGLAALFTLSWVSRRCLGHTPASAPAPGGWTVAITCLVLALVWGLAWLVPYFVLRGSVDAREYASAPATFRLPWPAGESSWVIQGPDSSLNHNDDTVAQKHSWDFWRRCGTRVLAAADGMVTRVVDDNDGIGGENNLVEVTHADGTVASYLHIQRGSGVAENTVVTQGTRVARVGCVGNSLTGHIHFMVRQGSDTIPIRFADITTDGGVPRGWSTYTSDNG